MSWPMLADEAQTFVREGTDADVAVERQVSMRYKGQGWEIPVQLDDGEFDEITAELLTARFTKAYEEFFGRAIDDLTIEAVSWAVRVASVQDPPPRVELLVDPANNGHTRLVPTDVRPGHRRNL